MNIEVKLYSFHDMDLLALYKSGRIVFSETTRQILNSYARKEVYRVKLLPTNHKRLARYPSDVFKKYYSYHIELREDRDADAIRLIKSISEGFRNNFIKVLLRQYLCGTFVASYNVDGDSSFFEEMSSLFQGEKESKTIKKGKNIDTVEIEQEYIKKEPKKELKREQRKEKSSAETNTETNPSDDYDEFDDFLMGVIEQY